MARNTAAQGREFEHSVIHYLAGCDCETTYSRPRHIGWRGYGYDFIRSAASKGKVDLVAIGPDKPINPESLLREDTDCGPLLFIQCKLSNPVISPAERLAVQNLALRARALPLVAWRAKDVYTGRIHPHFRILTGPGPKDWAAWQPGEDD